MKDFYHVAMHNSIQFLQYIFCLFVIYTKANPLQGDANSIVPANPNEFPFVVSIAVAPANITAQHFCGGTLISKSYILSARHCFENVTTHEPHRNATDIRVTIGSIDMTIGRKYGISYWITYADWALQNDVPPNFIYNDLAIVRLAEDVNDIEPAHISQCKHKQVRGRNAVTAGWGSGNDALTKQLLQKSSLHVISRKKCRFNFHTVHGIQVMVVNHLCTVQRPPVILGCGDSGSPLLINGNQLIAVNQGVCVGDIAHPNEQNSHQSVEYYRKFIESFAEKTVPCPAK